MHIAWFCLHFRRIFDKCSPRCRSISKHSVSLLFQSANETLNQNVDFFPNENRIVFLKNVSKETLEDLITFIYSGQVDVKHENLEEVLNTAKALNIKGLSDQSYAPFADSQPSTFNSSIPATEGVQYQSTHTIRVPETTKPDQDQLSYCQQPTNALDQHLSEDINEMNGHGNDYNNSCYDYVDYGFSEMCHDDPMAMDQEWDFDSIHDTEVQPAKPNVLKLAKRVVCGIGRRIFSCILK